MRLAIQGVGVLGGFGCGVGALRKALTDQETRIQKVSVKTAQGLRDVACLPGGYGQAERFCEQEGLAPGGPLF